MQGQLKDIFSRKAEQEENEKKHEDLYKTRKVPYKKDDMRLLEKLMKSYLQGKKGSVGQLRWTKLDDELEKLGEKISQRNLPPELQGRLAHLKEIGLADKSENYWSLKKDWKNVLVSTGRYNTFFAEWQKSDSKLELYSGGAVSGVVEGVITFDKDEAWNDALIVKDGERLVYVPIWQLKKQNIVGKKVKISGGDRALSRQLKDKDIHVVDDTKRQNYKKRI